MKYFLDQEFISGFYKPLFGKRRHFIDLISIGIVAEDGRKYQAISSEYDYDDADDWVKENVIHPLYMSTVHGDQRNQWSARNFHKHYGMTNNEIAEQVKNFVYLPYVAADPSFHLFLNNYPPKDIEFYGYYADYDWVLFCSLFGRMIDLPAGFPMYCRDLKQMLDEKAQATVEQYAKSHAGDDRVRVDFDYVLDAIKSLNGYPKQTNAHNALADAQWNKELYDFIQKI